MDHPAFEPIKQPEDGPGEPGREKKREGKRSIVWPGAVDDVTAEWLGAAVGRPVAGIEVVDRHSGTTGRARVAVRWGDGEPGPETVFVKLPPFGEQQRELVFQVAQPMRVREKFAGLAAQTGRSAAAVAEGFDGGAQFPHRGVVVGEAELVVDEIGAAFNDEALGVDKPALAPRGFQAAMTSSMTGFSLPASKPDSRSATAASTC